MKRQPLQLDFIAPRRHARWFGYMLLVVSLLVAADLVLRYRYAQVELARLETGNSMLNVERRPPPPIPREQLDAQIKQVQLIVRQLALPWATLIHALEEATINDVAILQLQPDAQQRLLRITAEARHQKALLEYLRLLASAKALQNVHLLSHEVQVDQAQRPIQFSVQASFAGAP